MERVMAHIQKMTDKPRTLPWRAHINRKGHKAMVKMFATRSEAQRWADEQERSIRLAGLPLTIEDLKNQTVGDIVRRYLKEVTPTKGSHVSETTVLNAFLRRDMAKKSLAYVKKQDAWAYINERLQEKWRKKPITPRTVRREINSIQHVFEIAKERWGLDNLNNPFRGVAIKGSTHRRKRRLHEGELEKLANACKSCRGLNRYYVPLAIYLAIETGMRLQEIFNLTWSDTDFEKRRIEIRKSKSDHVSGVAGRTIVLTMTAQWYLLHVAISLQKQRRFKLDDCVFPMTKEAFKQSWADVRKRAKIGDLAFHDLRREAGSWFDEAGLTKAEHDLMMGHANRDMTSLYIHSDLKAIQDKLDRHIMGRTQQDTVDEAEAIEEAASIMEGAHGEKPKEFLTFELGLLPDLRAKVLTAIAKRRQTSTKVVPLLKA
jgi:integrase